jgi:hypothetical protein
LRKISIKIGHRFRGLTRIKLISASVKIRAIRG